MAGRNITIKDGDKIIGFVHQDFFDDYNPDTFINQEAFKRFRESMELAEKVLKDFYITVRTNPEGTEYTFKKVDGTNLNSEFFAYKSDVRGAGWSVTDKLSGISIKLKLNTLKDCKEYLANLSDEDKARIEELRQKPKYQQICKELTEFRLAEDQELNQDFPEPAE